MVCAMNRVKKEKGEINVFTTNVVSASIEQKDTVVVNKSNVLEEDSKKDDSSFIVRIINFFKKIFRAISQFFSRIKKFFLSLFHR